MLDFNRIGLVANREWRTRLRQRSFQITTIVQVIVVIAAASAPAIITRFAGDAGEPRARTVLVHDETGADVAAGLAPLAEADDELFGFFESDTIEATASEATEEELRDQVADGEIDGALIVVRDDTGDLAFTFVAPDGADGATAQRIHAAVSAIAMQDRLERSDIDPDAFVAALAPPLFTVEGATGEAVESDDPEFGGAEIVLSYFFTIVMFMAIMLYGTWVAQGVVEEKSSRIMEIMVNAATPRDLLAGKVLGIGAAGLTQLLPMLLAGGLVFSQQDRIARLIGAETASLPDIDFGGLSVTAVGWFLVYFLLGFVLYAAIYAALGSLVSRQEEVNQAISPMMTFLMIGYLAAFFTMWMPDSVISRVLSIFPLTSPLVMVSRTLMGEPSTWEMILSVTLLAAAMLLAILFAARIYRMGVLWYGQKPSWKAIFTNRLEQSAR